MKLMMTMWLAAGVALQGQSLVENSMAAAGGSAAGVAGKTVSEGFDKLMGKASGVLDAASGATKEKKSGRSLPQEPAMPKTTVNAPGKAAARTRVAAPAVRGGVNRNGGRGGAQNIAATRRPREIDSSDVLLQPVMAMAAAPETRQATAGDLQALSPGASRDQVTERLGKPAAKITTAEDGKLVEVLTFRNNEGRVGTVRLVDGAVADIRPAN